MLYLLLLAAVVVPTVPPPPTITYPLEISAPHAVVTSWSTFNVPVEKTDDKSEVAFSFGH